MINEDMHNWIASYPYLTKVINEMGLKKGVELGVAAGRHSEYILQNTKVEKLWSIDRWLYVEGYEDACNLPQEEQDELYEYVSNKLNKFGERSVVIRQDTTSSAELFEDGSLDFVYVDADHSYEGCKRDIITWLPKIRKGGIISGHDLNFNSVAKAVSEVLKSGNNPNSVMNIGDSCWAQVIA